MNVGGGFPAHQGGQTSDLKPILGLTRATVQTALISAHAPELTCPLGAANVAEAFTVADRAKTVRGAGGEIFQNDGIYGGLADLSDMGTIGRFRVVSHDCAPRFGTVGPRMVFGQRCNSLD